MRRGKRWVMPASVCLSTALFTLPALALDIVACLAAGSPLTLTDDPRSCPSDRRLDAISMSVNFTASTTTTGGGGGSVGKTIPSDLKIAKRLDGTSTSLFMHTVQGRHLPNVLVVAFDSEQRGGARRVFSILLTDVTITQFEISATDSARTGAPTELVAFRYDVFHLRDDQTGRTTGYNFKTAQSF